MSGEFHAETLLAAGYAVLLILIAMLLEWLARHSVNRSGQYDTGGFRFHRDQDTWECPQGTMLERREVDHELRVVHYRAPADTCNGCSMKANCTNSDGGRTISISLDPWVRSAAAHFQRGISLVLLILAALIVSIELHRHGHGAEGWILAGLLALIGFSGMNLVARLSEYRRI